MNSLDQYPTPETDAMESICRYPEYHEGATKYVDREKCRDLERRLAACRGFLRETAKTSSSSRIRREAMQIWTLTAPKP